MKINSNLTNHTEVQEEVLRKMITEIKDYAIIILNPNGDIVSWNTGAENIKGYSSHEIIGENFSRFYTSKDLAEGKHQGLLELARKDGLAHDEGWRVRKDGTKFWASVSITAIHDEKGDVTGFGKVTRDLSERKKSEEDLQKLNRAIDEIADYAIILIDDNGIIQNWNQGAQNIKGYQREEILGKTFRQFYTLQDLDNKKPETLLENARKNGKAQDEGWRVRKGGEKFWASVTITAIHDENGEVKGFSKVTRDLTELKKASDDLSRYTRELEDKNQELNQFAYIASHDLREPLNTVKSVISIIEDKYSGQLDDAADKLFGYVTEATERMNELIKGLLDYGRIGMKSELEKVDTNQLAEEVKQDLRNRINTTKAKVNIHPLPELNVYKTEFRLLLQNLISNGIKFHKTDVSPEVDVSANRTNGHWTFRIKDNGIGIPHEYRNKLFMLFQRLPTEAEYEGTGIGLAHCKKIVDLHGGEIWVESEPDAGSSFFFSIPAN